MTSAALAVLPLAHVRWFTPDPNRGVERAAVFSGVTLLALAAIAATLGGAWVAQRLVARHRLAARARALAAPLLDRFALGLPRPADVYPWVAGVLALYTACPGRLLYPQSDPGTLARRLLENRSG